MSLTTLPETIMEVDCLAPWKTLLLYQEGVNSTSLQGNLLYKNPLPGRMVMFSVLLSLIEALSPSRHTVGPPRPPVWCPPGGTGQPHACPNKEFHHQCGAENNDS